VDVLDYLALRVAGLRPSETSLFQSLGTDPESGSVPDEEFQPITLAVAEQEQVPAQRLTRQSIPNQTVQPLEPLAHVGDPGGRIDPCSWAYSLGARTHSHQNKDVPRSGNRLAALLSAHKWRRLASAISSRPIPPSRLHQLAGQRSWAKPSIPTPLFQMAIHRAEAQPSTLAKTRSAAYRSSRIPPPTPGFRACTSLGEPTTLFLCSSGDFNTAFAFRTGMLVRRLPSQGDRCKVFHRDREMCSPFVQMGDNGILHNPSRRGREARPERNRVGRGLRVEVAVVRIARTGISVCRDFVLYHLIFSAVTTRIVTGPVHVAVGPDRN